jgi:hypothetical protein
MDHLPFAERKKIGPGEMDHSPDSDIGPLVDAYEMKISRIIAIPQLRPADRSEEFQRKAGSLILIGNPQNVMIEEERRFIILVIHNFFDRSRVGPRDHVPPHPLSVAGYGVIILFLKGHPLTVMNF